MSEREPISLYKCHRCTKQIFEDQISRGEGCKSCGSVYVSPAPANLRYVLGYFLHNPRQIVTFIKENVLGPDPIFPTDAA